MTTRTPRLTLVACTAQLVRYEMVDLPRLGEVLDAVVPDGWPPEDHRDVLQFFHALLEAKPDDVGYHAWYWLSSAEGPRAVMVGGGGFRGRPDDEGMLEVGYSVLPEFRAKGYATEGVTGLLHWGSAQGAKGFEAEALLENAASRRVLAKCGFREVGPGREPGHTRYRRPAIDPEADETGQA